MSSIQQTWKGRLFSYTNKLDSPSMLVSGRVSKSILLRRRQMHGHHQTLEGGVFRCSPLRHHAHGLFVRMEAIL